jgi:hypothetical protein
MLTDRSVNYHQAMTTHVDERQWLAPKEVASALRVDVASVYRAIRDGRHPHPSLSP